MKHPIHTTWVKLSSRFLLYQLLDSKPNGIQLDVVLEVPNKIAPTKKIDNKNLTTKPTIVACKNKHK